MIASALIAKHRLIHVLKLDRLEAELSEKIEKQMTPAEFRSDLEKKRMRVVENIYKYIFTCLPNRASKKRLIDELVDEYSRRLNHQH